ncbi:MAG: psp operon transcriptional activator [Halieaceae bacterium]|jgi:psp operon transcriptional activator
MPPETQKLIGNSPALAEALDQVSQLASINRPVLIIGERGTGKELAAERLHFLSPRWDETLDKVNCAAISEQLLESELFGHEPGAFTGATRTHRGRFERADGGTLLLDELATMSLRLQEKLLRLIEYGEFERLGGQQTLKVDVRLVAATNADLKLAAARGEFREDLLDRLSFDVVHLPPLRYRREDIAELAIHFATQICHEIQWEYFPGFSASALRELHQHNWPGNVRELKNAVERSVYRWGEQNGKVDTIVLDPFDSPYTQLLVTPAVGVEIPAETPPVSNLAVEGPAEDMNFEESTAQFQRDLIRGALTATQGHQGRTAERLELSYNQLRGLLRKYQINARDWE